MVFHDEWLNPDKVLRDAVHGDVFITSHEVEVIDTATFQRLRYIRQLGSSYLVFPGAEHSRFQHSIGTLAMADRIVRSVRENTKGEIRHIEPRDHYIIRLAALLHDLPHIPFGHTLEDEMCCYEVDHDSRFEEFLGRDTEIGAKLERWGVLEEVAAILSSKSKPIQQTVGPRKTFDPIYVGDLEKPFMADIVKNTICADLLDYAARDTYFAGIRHTYDPRLFSYFEIAVTEGKPRVAIRLLNRNGIRRSVASEILHLLRLRYSLGERVYYHKTKMVTAAMLGRAFMESKLKPEHFYALGDERALALIAEKGGSRGGPSKQAASPLARELIDLLRSRRLYKSAYVVGANLNRNQRIELAQQYHRDASQGSRAQERREFEDVVAEECGLSAGQVLVYCPDSNMSLKEAKVKVRWSDGQVRPLSAIDDDPVIKEIEEIEGKHQALWRMYVFVHPEHASKGKLQEVSDAVFAHTGVHNELSEFTQQIIPLTTRRLKDAARRLDLSVRQMDDLEDFAAKVARSAPVPDTAAGWMDLWSELRGGLDEPDEPAQGTFDVG